MNRIAECGGSAEAFLEASLGKFAYVEVQLWYRPSEPERTDEQVKGKRMIETERLLLREYTKDDFGALYEILSDAETMQHYPAPYDEAKTRRWIEWNLENYAKYGFGLWAVVLKETGKFIGDCGITIQNIDGEQLPEIGYHIHKKYWRRGFAKEAAQAVRDWAFENTDYPSLYSYCKYTNEASYKTAEAIGMHFDKEYPDEANGITHVSVIHRITAPEIREAETGDAEEMISYLNIVGGESDNLMHGAEGFKAPVEAVKRRIQASHDADNSVILIALEGGKIIARAELAGYPGARLHHNATFSISVRKDHWNMKIGTMLMTEIIERAKKMKLRNIELEVVAGNKAAIALYHKMGFSDVGVYKNYWFANNVYSDAIIMQKCLDD